MVCELGKLPRLQVRLSAPSLGMRLVGWFGVRLSAPSLGLRLVIWFGSEAVCS